MSKFKVGDRVRIKNSLSVGKEYGSLTFLEVMKPYAGLSYKIDDITRMKSDFFYIADAGYAFYTEEMLELVTDEKIYTQDDLECILQQAIEVERERIMKQMEKVIQNV